MKKQLILAIILVVSIVSCNKDGDDSSTHKGIVQFKPYTTAEGLVYALYSNNTISFTVEMQLSGSSQDINVDIDYHLLDGSTKIYEGKVRVNKNLDGGLGMFWGADEHAAPIDGNAFSGKTITVYLDPHNKYTDSQYTSEEYINLYKKTTVLIP